MSGETGLSTMAREVELAQGYLEIEKVRLGERLHVEWHIDKMPKLASIPPLILQPLLENAIYHGIEPHIEPGIIQLNVFRVRDEVHIDIRNPLFNHTPLRRGNGMALDNVRERLLLYYDAEANLSINSGNDYYQIHITLPYREL
jgi:two-component system sensor histidine kinase AlgZ